MAADFATLAYLALSVGLRWLESHPRANAIADAMHREGRTVPNDAEWVELRRMMDESGAAADAAIDEKARWWAANRQEE